MSDDPAKAAAPHAQVARVDAPKLGPDSFSSVTNRLLRYLSRLTWVRIILWCYFIWYLVILVRYFDPNPRLWLTSVGLSLIIGCALLLNARAGPRRALLHRWQVIRLFLTPFCVSSFAALAKGHKFYLIFPSSVPELLTALGLCGLFCLTCALLKWGLRGDRIRPNDQVLAASSDADLS